MKSAPGVNCTVFIGTSLDGFIAREDGAIDWLDDPEATNTGEDYGYQRFFDTVDVMIMGRNTFELARTFEPWPYGDTRVVVLSSHDVEIPATLAATVEATSAKPRQLLRQLADRGFTHAYVDGGKTIQSFLAEGLIQRLIITRLPILIGSGLPLFGPVPADTRLQHVQTRTYPDGLVQTEYRVRDAQVVG